MLDQIWPESGNARAYHLTLTEATDGFLISIHRDLEAQLSTFGTHTLGSYFSKEDLAYMVGGDCGDVQFHFPIGGNAGFGGILEPLDCDGMYIQYLAKFPFAEKKEVCKFCGGSKRDRFDYSCHFCEGTGRAWVVRFHEINALAASLSILFTSLEVAAHNTKIQSNYEQRFLFDTTVRSGMHGGNLLAKVSPRFISALTKVDDDEVVAAEVTGKMKFVWEGLTGRPKKKKKPLGLPAERFYIWEDGRFTLGCFGDACDLSIYPESCRSGNGWWENAGCHNVDTSSQQLTLITGLVALCEALEQRGHFA